MNELKALILVVWAGLVIGSAPPPARPPPHILQELTYNGQIPLEYYYVDDSNKGQGTHYKYSYADISQLISQGKDFIAQVLSSPIPPPPQSHPHSSTWSTQLTDIWLVHAFNKYGIADANVVVFGSTSPWYEALCLASGAAHVTTIEYNRLTYDHPNISTLIATDPLVSHTHFDIALSLSSFDHDGLGRYGDPINPNGDLVAMESAHSVLREGGLLILTVPIGPDVIVWNLHRRYGNIRLPLLLKGWVHVETIGWEESLVERHTPFTAVYEPVFVLNNTNIFNNN